MGTPLCWLPPSPLPPQAQSGGTPPQYTTECVKAEVQPAIYPASDGLASLFRPINEVSLRLQVLPCAFAVQTKNSLSLPSGECACRVCLICLCGLPAKKKTMCTTYLPPSESVADLLVHRSAREGRRTSLFIHHRPWLLPPKPWTRSGPQGNTGASETGTTAVLKSGHTAAENVGGTSGRRTFFISAHAGMGLAPAPGMYWNGRQPQEDGGLPPPPPWIPPLP